MLRSGGVTFLGVTRAHVMPTFARVARNNSIPKRDGYLRDATRNYLPALRRSAIIHTMLGAKCGFADFLAQTSDPI